MPVKEEVQRILAEQGAQPILQAVLKTTPEKRTSVLKLVSDVGAEAAVRIMFGIEQRGAQPGSAQLAPPAMATPQVGAAGQSSIDVPSSFLKMQGQRSEVNPVGVGSKLPQGVGASTVGQRAAYERAPASISLPTQIPSTPGAVPQENMPAAPAQELPTESTDTLGQVAEPLGPEPAPSMGSPEAQTSGYPLDLMPVTPIGMPYISPTIFRQSTTDFDKVCEANRLPMPFVLAVIKQESNFDPKVLSSAKAAGLMQLMPGTARDMGLTVTTKRDDRFFPKKNISAGAKYFGWLRDTYKIKTVDELLAAYNAGPGRLKDKAWKKIPETVGYISSIKRHMKEYETKPEKLALDLSRLYGAMGIK